MEEYTIQFIESLVAITIVIIISKVLQRVVDKAGEKYAYHKTRIKIIRKMLTLILTIVLTGILLLVWGIAPSQLVASIASLFTVVGIAFLAQWSIVSNITSTLIIFFNHQVKIGDSIVILDKDYQVEGEISDIGIFFIIIKVAENEYVSLPSNVFMQKMVKKIRK